MMASSDSTRLVYYVAERDGVNLVWNLGVVDPVKK